MPGMYHWACCCECAISNLNEETINDPAYGWNPVPSVESGSMTGTFNFVTTENCGGDACETTPYCLQGGEAYCQVYFDVAKNISYSISGTFRDFPSPERAEIHRDGVKKASVYHEAEEEDYCLLSADSDSQNESSVAAGWHLFYFLAVIDDPFDLGWQALTEHAVSFSVTWTDA